MQKTFYFVILKTNKKNRPDHAVGDMVMSGSPMCQEVAHEGDSHETGEGGAGQALDL